MKVTWPVLLPLLKENPLLKYLEKEGGWGQEARVVANLLQRTTYPCCQQLIPVLSLLGHKVREKKKGALSSHRGSAKKTASPCFQECEDTSENKHS